jgi:hypothetical protein
MELADLSITRRSMRVSTHPRNRRHIACHAALATRQPRGGGRLRRRCSVWWRLLLQLLEEHQDFGLELRDRVESEGLTQF